MAAVILVLGNVFIGTQLSLGNGWNVKPSYPLGEAFAAPQSRYSPSL
ncbi:MAG: hypothetical protein ABIR29_05605 [Chthoniobacterales bacterium]